MPSQPLTLEIVGEGKTDIGKAEGKATAPTTGVVPLLVHRLCGSPGHMRVIRKPVPFLQGKGWWQKVRFAKQPAQGNRSAGLVFVLDTEGDFKKRKQDLEKGRDSCLQNYPMAVGYPHPCLEAWLLADAVAIATALNAGLSQLPTQPEDLPAPAKNPARNPKTELARCAGKSGNLSAKEKDAIVKAMKDLSLIHQCCPRSFAPFADEIEQRIKPLFGSP